MQPTSTDGFVPITPRGSTRFEMQNRGAMRPGKTRRKKGWKGNAVTPMPKLDEGPRK